MAIPVVGAEAANVATKRRGPAAETMAVAAIRGAAVRRQGVVVGVAADPVAAMAPADVAAVAVAGPAATVVAGPVATVVAGPVAGAAEADSLFACPGCLPNRGTLVA